MDSTQQSSREAATADSLFDGRYRYNYIYPRGRSGETLRAVDTLADNRPVVIKRPNPNDAPPIRAGQEVSIINEREALARLAGHPVLTELLGSGQFFVGGIPHQYIVMERAEGLIIADEVARLAGQQARLPELEMLEIIERLVNLLRTAHDNDIVYNDVDAKHLFWNSERYQLKVIDWGNAVFLQGDESAQGISRQSDIYQVGELLYFILSGGYRVEVPRDAGAEFRVEFHQDAAAVDISMQAIVTRAVHPNLRYRYASLSELSADLARYRSPLERERDAVVARVSDRLASADLSRSDLLSLKATLGAALRANPAYPAARQASQEIVDRLRDLEVSADLDAVKIYIQSDKWSSAAALLSELRDRAGSRTAGLVRLLLDWCLLLADSPSSATPPSLAPATALLFDYRAEKAANTLLTSAGADEELRSRLAERVSAHFPDVLLLQPNLRRLDTAARQLESDGIPVGEAREILATIRQGLAEIEAMPAPGAGALRDIYGEIVESLSALNASLQTMSLQHEFSERRLPLNALTRALNAAMALADNMHVIGKGAANNPRDALSALDASRAIDPQNPVWDKVEDALSLLYEILQNSQTYVPAADGADLEGWLVETRSELLPFADLLFDDMLNDMLAGIEIAREAWARYREVIIAGDRAGATAALNTASKSLSQISPTLSNWFSQTRAVVEKASYVERHSVPGHLGRTLADGWAAFDRGQLADAQRLGQQALEIARSESEEKIADRLWRLSRSLREWVERAGVESEDRSQAALLAIEALFTEGENRAINSFAAQMPSTETYLKAMGQGLVGAFAATNTAALRILFAQYIFCGALDAHDGVMDDARFWQEAALRALPKTAERHPALRKLDEFIDRRQNLLDAQDLFHEITGPHIIDSLGEMARQLEANPQARLLVSGMQSLGALESALNDWADAEFRAAGNKLEQALRSVTEVESNASIKLEPYRAWLMSLQAALAELSVKRRNLISDIDRQDEAPLASIREAIHAQADTTEDLLGYKTAQMMLGWRDTYEAFFAIYQGDKRRGQKLQAMDELFKALFIDRNPAYPLFRLWYRQIEAQPEEPEEPAAHEPEAPALPESQASTGLPEETEAEADERPKRSRRLWFNLAALLGVILVAGGLASLGASGNLESILAAVLPASPTPAPSPTLEATSAPALAPDDEIAPNAASDLPPTSEATATETPAPTDIPTEMPTLGNTAVPTVQPTVSLPPGGLSGRQSLLELFADRADERPHFSQQGGSWRLGTSAAGTGETLLLYPSAQELNARYGADAPRRVRRLEAELALRSANAAVVGDGDIYFGIMLMSPEGERRAGLQVRQDAPDVISLAQVRDDAAPVVSQRSVNNLIARLRLDRDVESGSVRAYFNDALVGDPLDFIAGEADALPVIFARDGGLVVSVTAWDLVLD